MTRYVIAELLLDTVSPMMLSRLARTSRAMLTRFLELPRWIPLAAALGSQCSQVADARLEVKNFCLRHGCHYFFNVLKSQRVSAVALRRRFRFRADFPRHLKIPGHSRSFQVPQVFQWLRAGRPPHALWRFKDGRQGPRRLDACRHPVCVLASHVGLSLHHDSWVALVCLLFSVCFCVYAIVQLWTLPIL